MPSCVTDPESTIVTDEVFVAELFEILRGTDTMHLDLTTSTAGKVYAKELRTSDDIRTLIESNQTFSPLKFDPESDVTQSVKIREHDDGNGIEVTVTDRIENTNEDSGYTRYRENIAIGQFIDGELVPYGIKSGRRSAPLVGRGELHKCEKDGITTSLIWIS